MDSIPLLGWVGIAFIVIFTLAINISLIAMLRSKTPPRLTMRQQRPGGFIGAAQDLAKMGRILRDPFGAERSQLNELSRRVEQLPPPSDPDAGSRKA
jgi:hypothetical protein